jgi:1,4-dihydroxy-2-naphthoyl-CoA synthase
MIWNSPDVVIAAEDAQFGLSEVNWGILPAGNASRALAEAMRTRDALYYIMTGELFDGRKAAEVGLVNEAVPKEKLRERVRELADVLLEKSPAVLKGAKDAFKRVQQLDWDMSEDYLISKQEQLWFVAGEEREEGFRQFPDEKSFKPGLGMYKRPPRKLDMNTSSKPAASSNTPAWFDEDLLQCHAGGGLAPRLVIASPVRQGSHLLAAKSTGSDPG